MTEARFPTPMSGEKPVIEECRTIRELLPAGITPEALAPDETRAVRVHLAACTACREAYDGSAAVPAHLRLLRDALARGQGRHRRACPAGRTARGDASPRHRRPDRAAASRQITLSQWVSKTTSYTR
ncbi:zf-HC2 domain-containing protein [Streptomyces sp. NPDC057697]|uniref:zf-HC2 domain-containing protein n=1 Tax=Streptomyces sp. NPDC057697 TaxID=3346219 RepID=UPI0036C6F3CD